MRRWLLCAALLCSLLQGGVAATGAGRQSGSVRMVLGSWYAAVMLNRWSAYGTHTFGLAGGNGYGISENGTAYSLVAFPIAAGYSAPAVTWGVEHHATLSAAGSQAVVYVTGCLLGTTCYALAHNAYLPLHTAVQSFAMSNGAYLGEVVNSYSGLGTWQDALQNALCLATDGTNLFVGGYSGTDGRIVSCSPAGAHIATWGVTQAGLPTATAVQAICADVNGVYALVYEPATATDMVYVFTTGGTFVRRFSPYAATGHFGDGPAAAMQVVSGRLYLPYQWNFPTTWYGVAVYGTDGTRIGLASLDTATVPVAGSPAWIPYAWGNGPWLAAGDGYIAAGGKAAFDSISVTVLCSVTQLANALALVYDPIMGYTHRIVYNDTERALLSTRSLTPGGAQSAGVTVGSGLHAGLAIRGDGALLASIQTSADSMTKRRSMDCGHTWEDG